MWGLGLIMLCLLAFVIIGVLSNVTLTNQQDYYGVKQTSEATSYDSVDVVSYKRGICVCAKTSLNNGTVKINNVNEYTITEPDENNNCENKVNCELRIGEYVIDPKLFNENIIVRLGSIIKASEVYDIKVQEIIPYPPKISVYISYHQALNIEGNDTINSEIPNKFDGIFEDTGTQSVLTYADNNLTNWELSCGTQETKTYCYYDKDGNVSSNKWRFCPELTDESKCTAAGYEAKIEVSDSSKCVDACFCKNGQSCVMSAKVEWGGGWTVEPLEKCGAKSESGCYKKGSSMVWVKEGETPPAGYKLDKSITDSTKCPPGTSVKSKCTYHYYNDSVKCYYYTKASRTLVTCASKQYSGNYKCNSDETRGTQTCSDASTETVKCVKNKATVYTTTKAYEVSQDGAYGKSASEAVEECKKAAKKYCTDKGYSGADAQNCKAVQDWTASGYDGQGNPKTQTLKHQSSQRNCNAFNQVAYCLSIECNG